MSAWAPVASWLLAPAMLVMMIVVTGPSYYMGDFRAFYCAGAVIGARADPYLEEPLHGCELAARPPGARASAPDVTLPAPLPPDALLAFVPFARLPFAAAGVVYALLLIAAMCAAVVLFARATGVSSTLLNVAFAGITATQTYFLGQPLPFVLVALAAAAVLLRGGRWVAASACAAIATIEPQIALPVIVAMFVAAPRTRVPLIGSGALLALVSAAAVGWPVTVSYVRDVIPAHALANAFEWQYSLTSVLTSFGVGAIAAVHSGEAMYAVMTVAGVAVAWRMYATTADRTALVLVPPAFAAFGGVHVHQHDLIIAFPAILAAYQHHPRVRNLAATGVTLAMIPWNIVSASVMTGWTPFLVGVFARSTMGARRGLVLTAFAAVIAISVLALALAGFGPGETHFVAHAYPQGGLAENSWGDFSRAVLARPSVLLQWLRLPVLIGLGLGLVAITRAAFEPVRFSPL